MAGAGGLLPGAAGEKWEEKLWLVERLVKRLGGGGGGCHGETGGVLCRRCW